MYKVTENRLEKARHILDQYSQKLQEHGKFSTSSLEEELKEAWDTGYKSIKSAMVDLYKNHGGKHGRVAEYYMRHDSSAMVSEFKNALGVR